MDDKHELLANHNKVLQENYTIKSNNERLNNDLIALRFELDNIKESAKYKNIHQMQNTITQQSLKLKQLKDEGHITLLNDIEGYKKEIRGLNNKLQKYKNRLKKISELTTRGIDLND
jgi:predicted  nucleic acid-binding Zn-ribbon protein|tara:strand:+ start:6759 stop:7109 length:351 start_codon:yes stop_codon:yes gene_type:complete